MYINCVMVFYVLCNNTIIVLCTVRGREMTRATVNHNNIIITRINYLHIVLIFFVYFIFYNGIILIVCSTGSYCCLIFIIIRSDFAADGIRLAELAPLYRYNGIIVIVKNIQAVHIQLTSYRLVNRYYFSIK